MKYSNQDGTPWKSVADSRGCWYKAAQFSVLSSLNCLIPGDLEGRLCFACIWQKSSVYHFALDINVLNSSKKTRVPRSQVSGAQRLILICIFLQVCSIFLHLLGRERGSRRASSYKFVWFSPWLRVEVKLTAPLSTLVLSSIKWTTRVGSPIYGNK